MRERLEIAALFIGKLYELSHQSSQSWRRADSVGRDIGLAGAHSMWPSTTPSEPDLPVL